jgi:hypothetical protein
VRLRESAERSLGFRWDGNEFTEFLDRAPVLTQQSVKAASLRAGRLPYGGGQVFAHAMLIPR